MPQMNHFNQQGQAHMVNVGHKSPSLRTAVATGVITMQTDTLQHVTEARKGDVLGIARIAAIQASKKTAELIPLCHPIALRAIEVDFVMDKNTIRCTATTTAQDVTGVEMESLTAVSVGLLTIYDMLKAVDRGMRIGDICLLHKQGGQSGDWHRAQDVAVGDHAEKISGVS